MKTFIILALLYGLVAAENDCGLTIEAEKDYECSEFVTVAIKEPYEVAGVTVDLLKKLNPRLDCNKKIPRGIEVCVEGPSKFDDKAVQAATTLDKFQKAMGQLKNTRSNKFNPELFDSITKVVKEQKTLRRKRGANDPPTATEKAMIENLSKESSIDAIKAAIAKDQNFKALEEEFNKGRYAACAQLKEKEKDQTKKGKYRMCVCARGKEKYPNGPPPFIHCQALLMLEKIEQQVKMDYNPNESPEKPKARAQRFARASSSKKQPFDFSKFMTKRGCPTMDCLTELCFSAGELCEPIPPFPILSICASGEGCMPNLANLIPTGGALQLSHFTDSKIGGKLGICITGFHSVLSWIGLDACLAAIQLEYYYFKNQLDLATYRGLVIVKLTVGVKAQVAKSFSKGINGLGIMLGNKKVDDICVHKDHKCEDYCALDPGQLAAYAKLEYWWWGWKEAFNKQWNPSKEGC